MAGPVFISYGHDDADYVERLAEFLIAQGIDVWLDREMMVGERWEQIISNQIVACRSMIVVMSPTSERSRWVSRELNLAETLEKPIFPLLLSGEVFFSLNDVHFEDVTDGRMPTDVFIRRMTAAEPERTKRANTSPAGRRPFYFDGVSFVEPRDLLDRMRQNWDLALDLVAGSQIEAFDAWLTNQVRDRRLPTNILHRGTGDERIAQLAAHFCTDQTPVFRSWGADRAGLCQLAQAAWMGDPTALAVSSRLTSHLLSIFATHSGCGELVNISRATALAWTSLGDLATTRLIGLLAALRDGFTPTELAIGPSDRHVLPAPLLRLSAGAMGSLLDDRFAESRADDSRRLPEVPRGSDWDGFVRALESLAEPARRVGLLVALTSAAGAQAREAIRIHEEERRREQADARKAAVAEDEVRRRQVLEDTQRRERKATEERDAALVAHRILRVSRFLGPCLAIMLGFILAKADVFDLMWLDSKTGPSFEIVVASAVVFFCAFILPFVALKFVFGDEKGLRRLAYAVYFLPSYIWTWIFTTF